MTSFLDRVLVEDCGEGGVLIAIVDNGLGEQVLRYFYFVPVY